MNQANSSSLFRSLSLSLLLIVGASQASAELSSTEGTSTLRITKEKLLPQFKENENVTDTKLKAESGSLSVFSLSFNLSYYGPTVGDLGAKDQPNPDGTPGTYETAIGGSLGARFRFDSRSSISTGTGLKAIHPFHGMERFDLNNPYLNYNLSDRFGEIQMRNTLGFAAVTIPNFTMIGETYSTNYDTSMVYSLGKSPWALGLDTSVAYFFYSRGYLYSDKKAARYNIAAYPNVKYNVSDKLNINTSVNFSAWNPRSRDDQSVLLNRTISERVGMGYAYTRDIYLNPYLNLFPDNVSDDGTTLNFTAIFSVL